MPPSQRALVAQLRHRIQTAVPAAHVTAFHGRDIFRDGHGVG